MSEFSKGKLTSLNPPPGIVKPAYIVPDLCALAICPSDVGAEANVPAQTQVEFCTTGKGVPGLTDFGDSGWR